MIRVVFFAALFPVLIVIVWEDAPSWVILAGWGIGFGLIGLGWWRGTLVLKCPYCFKRVKIGAQVCHHCGRVVTNTAAPGYRAVQNVPEPYVPAAQVSPRPEGLPDEGVRQWNCRPLAAGSLVSVVGESHYQAALEATFARATATPPLPVEGYAEEVWRSEDLPWILAILVRERDNDVDENAVAVWSDNGVIGYLRRDDAEAYQPVLATVERGGNEAGVCPAFLRRADNGMIGVVLALSEPRICLDEIQRVP